MTTLLDLETRFHEFALDPPADPRPMYDVLRREAPVFRTPLGFWYVTSYDLAKAVLRPGSGFSSDPATAAGSDVTHRDDYAFHTMRRMLMFMDGARHLRLRTLLNGVFTGRATERLRARVQNLIEEQVRELSRSDGADLRQDFALRLPTTVILEVLGLDLANTDLFIELSDLFIAMNEPQATEQTIRRANEVFRACADVVLVEAAQRRSAPLNDLLTDLTSAQVDGAGIAEDDLVATVLFLVIAGHETTGNTLVTGMYHLLANPRELQRLRDHPELDGLAVEELLRFDAATRNTGARFAERDLELGGVRIARGEKLYASLQGANHDPAVFQDPRRLDVGRDPNPHIAFAGGAHYCLGASLARMELQIALRTLLDTFSDIQLAGPVEWNRSFIIRGLHRLPLTWTRA